MVPTSCAALQGEQQTTSCNVSHALRLGGALVLPCRGAAS